MATRHRSRRCLLIGKRLLLSAIAVVVEIVEVEIECGFASAEGKGERKGGDVPVVLVPIRLLPLIVVSDWTVCFPLLSRCDCVPMSFVYRVDA